MHPPEVKQKKKGGEANLKSVATLNLCLSWKVHIKPYDRRI